MAAESFQFGFANPANYSDWAKYAGLDRTTGDFAKPAYSAQQSAGVEPPANLTEYAQQAVAPITTAFKNYSNAGSQVAQGNFMGAVNAMKGSAPKMGSPSNDDYQYESMIGQ